MWRNGAAEPRRRVNDHARADNSARRRRNDGTDVIMAAL
jgi:hypothetical protein